MGAAQGAPWDECGAREASVLGGRADAGASAAGAAGVAAPVGPAG